MAGLALGWLVRNAGRLIERINEHIGRPARRHPWRTVGLVLGGIVASAVILVQFLGSQPSALLAPSAPVSYSARATLDKAAEAFAMEQQLAIDADSLRLWGRITGARNPARALAQSLEAWGWEPSRRVGGTLVLSRNDQSESLDAGRFTRRETITLLPPEGLSEASLSAEVVEVEIVAPDNWIVATSPPSESESLPGDLEARQIETESNYFDETVQVQVEVAGPSFRSELGAQLLGLSFGSVTAWLVLLVFGVFQDELKKFIAGLFGRLKSLLGSGNPAA
jgi:hypothetical protein